MGWTQEDIITVYRAVKEAVANNYSPTKSRSQIVSEVKLELKLKFGYKHYCGYNRRLLASPGYNEKYKRFVKDKYYKIGLPSKEKDMLDNMIESVVDNLECNEVSLNDLKGTVSRMDVLTYRAKDINSDCSNILEELEKISNKLEEPCQNM